MPDSPNGGAAAARPENLSARLIWIIERIEDGDIGEAAHALRDLLQETT
jgi:hypothetical protein